MKEEEKKDQVYSRTTRRLNQELESRLKKPNKLLKEDTNNKVAEATDFSHLKLRRSVVKGHQPVAHFFESHSASSAVDPLDQYRRSDNKEDRSIKTSEELHPLDQYIASSGEFSDSFDNYLSSMENDGAAGETRTFKISDLEKVSNASTDRPFVLANQPEAFVEETAASESLEEVEEQETNSRSTFLIPNSLYYLQLLLVALVGGFSFYSFPLIHRVATGAALENLYAAFAMNHGVSPYINLFGSAGPLYYWVNQIGNIGGSTWVFWLIETLMLWLSAVIIFKMFDDLLGSKKLNLVISGFVTLMLAGLSLGGAQPILLAMPFALYGFRVLNRYFIDDKAAKDEVILLYGAIGALASLIFPAFLLLFVLGAFGLIGSNIARGNWGRGFYQLLCGLMGSVLVYAVVGYYTLTSQIFFPVIEQAILLPFAHLNFSLSALMNLGISLGLILLSGLLSSWLFGFYYIGHGRHRIWSTFLLLAAFLSLAVVSLQKNYSPVNAFVVLPFVVMFVGLKIDREVYQDGVAELTLGNAMGRFLSSTSFLPLLAVFLMLAFPFANNFLQADKINSEKAVAAYISQKTSIKDQVILVSEDNTIDYLSQRIATVTMPPSYYPANYAQTFDINLTSAKAKYIVIQKTQTLSDSVKSTLKTSYVDVKLNDKNFTVYQLK